MRDNLRREGKESNGIFIIDKVWNSNQLGKHISLTVFGFVPDSIEPPTAVVGVVDNIEYDTSMARGADTYTIPVFLYVSLSLIHI